MSHTFQSPVRARQWQWCAWAMRRMAHQQSGPHNRSVAEIARTAKRAARRARLGEAILCAEGRPEELQDLQTTPQSVRGWLGMGESCVRSFRTEDYADHFCSNRQASDVCRTCPACSLSCRPCRGTCQGASAASCHRPSCLEDRRHRRPSCHRRAGPSCPCSP